MKIEQTNFGDESAPASGGVDLHLELSGHNLRAGLSAALREAVRSGRLAPGTQLPASRTLAADLGIARSTVTECYAALVAEGWLIAQQGSGTRVAERAKPAPSQPTTPRTGHSSRRMDYGLLPGSSDYGEFPRSQWLSASRRALTSAPHSAFGYGDVLGRIELRAALTEYLARVRGVQSSPDQVVICAGFHHGLTLMARVLKARGVEAIAVEAFGLNIYREVLRASGLRLVPLGVDAGGARTEGLGATRSVGAVLLTPAHQFPTGVALSPQRRAAVVDWARATGGLILEDDYDGEFRYDRQPVGALQGLDPGQVVYFGTASKSLAPGLRLGWMVPPDHLMAEVSTAIGYVEPSSALEQLTLAEFISSGSFDRHVRAMRQRYRRRRDQLIFELAQRSPRVKVTGMAAGLQAVIELPEGAEAAVLKAAAQRGVMVSGLTEFMYDPTSREADRARGDALVVNFAAPSESGWPGALDALCSVMP